MGWKNPAQRKTELTNESHAGCSELLGVRMPKDCWPQALKVLLVVTSFRLVIDWLIDQSAEISEVLQHFVGINLNSWLSIGQYILSVTLIFLHNKNYEKNFKYLAMYSATGKDVLFLIFLFLQKRTCHTIYHHSMSQQALVYLKQVLWNLSSILFLVYKIKFYSVKYCGLANTVNRSCLFLSHGTTVPQKWLLCLHQLVAKS